MVEQDMRKLNKRKSVKFIESGITAKVKQIGYTGILVLTSIGQFQWVEFKDSKTIELI